MTPTTLVSRLDVQRRPGADRSNSLAMITDYVPGAYVTHDQRIRISMSRNAEGRKWH